MASDSNYVYTTGSIIKLWGFWTAVKDDENNRSSFTYWLQLIRSGSQDTYDTDNYAKIRAKFNGVTQNEQTGMDFWVKNDTNGKSGFIINSDNTYKFSFNVPHNMDGTKQVNLKLEFEPVISSGSYIIGGQTYVVDFGTISFDPIPRASVLGTVSAFDLEDSFSVPVTKYSSSFTDKLDLSYGSSPIAARSSYTSGTAIKLSDDEILKAYRLMGTSETKTFTFKISTYYGSTLIGTSSKSVSGTSAGTMHVRVNGKWERAVPYVRVSGAWKKSLGYVRNSSWKRGKE